MIQQVLVMVCFLNTPLFCLFETELYAKRKIDKEKISAYLFYPDKYVISSWIIIPECI